MIGNRIRQAREEAGLTQEQCARLAGIDPSVYNRIENNKREPKASELLRLLPVLKVTPAHLLGIQAPEPESNGHAHEPAAMRDALPTSEAFKLLMEALLLMMRQQARTASRKASVAVKRAVKSPRSGRSRRTPPNEGGVNDSCPRPCTEPDEAIMWLRSLDQALTGAVRSVRAA